MTVYSPQFSNFVKFILKNEKNCGPSMKLLKSLCKRLKGSKEILLIYYFSLPDEGCEKKDLQNSQFFILILKILTKAGRFIILWISLGGWGRWQRSNVSVFLALCIEFFTDFWCMLIKLKHKHSIMPAKMKMNIISASKSTMVSQEAVRQF